MDIPDKTEGKSPDLFVRRDNSDVIPFIAGRRGRFDGATKSTRRSVRNQGESDKELRIRLDERAWLARELHDSTSQLLVALELQIIRLKEMKCAPNSKLFDDIMAALRSTISELHAEVRTLGIPVDLRASILASELGAMAREFADRTGLPIRTHLDELPAGVSSDIAHALYRIAQETLANASRHASSSSVSLDLNVESETVTLRTIDDGVGFKSVATSSGAGHGLANMQARVDQVGGKLTIRNLEPGAMIEARIPLGF